MESPPDNKYLQQILLSVSILAGIIYAPVILSMMKSGYDFVTHIQHAADMLAAGRVLTPHFFLHLAIIVLAFFSPEAIPNAAFALLLIATLATALIIALTLKKECAAPKPVILLTTALLIAAPVAVLAPFDGHLYYGYINPDSFHNPTMFLLKPLALVSFGLTLKAFENNPFPAIPVWTGIILTSIACALTKPSFTICILPAAALLFAIRLSRKESVNFTLLLFGLIVPALAVLAFQYNLAYSEEQLPGIYAGKSDIIFAPLIVMKKYSPWLLPKFLLSSIFPLAVLLCYFKAAVKDLGMQLAWIAFMIGTAYTYLLAESGPRMYHGNFCWSSEITIFILFVYSARFLLQNRLTHEQSDPVTSKRKFYLCSAGLSLHTIFGVAFYVAEIIQTERFW